MSGEELTRVELGDLAAAYGWWKAHGDPEAFYDVLDDALVARHAATLDERDALRAQVERVTGLADDWEHQRNCEWACECEMADDLRDALDGPA